MLLYAVVAIWTVAALLNWLAAQSERRAQRLWRVSLLAAILALPLVWPQAHALAAPKFWWGWRFSGHQVEDGLPQAAAFLRRHARPGDVFAVQGLSVRWAATDAATQLGAMTGVPAYLARPSIHLTGGEREKTALERHSALLRVAEEHSLSSALARLRERGIRWYVVTGAEGPRWDPERRQAVFTSGKLAIYSAADLR